MISIIKVFKYWQYSTQIPVITHSPISHTDRVALVAAPPSYTRMYHYFPAQLTHPFCYYPPPPAHPTLTAPAQPAPQSARYPGTAFIRINGEKTQPGGDDRSLIYDNIGKNSEFRTNNYSFFFCLLYFGLSHFSRYHHHGSLTFSFGSC